MISIVLISLLNFFALQQPEWQKLSSLKLYPPVKLHQFDTLTMATINAMPYKEVNLNEAKSLLNRPLKQQKTAMFKGSSRLAVCTFIDGTTSKLLISSYGGFFYDSQHKTNYILPEADHDAWYALLEKYKME